MTQEELDALMADGLEDENLEDKKADMQDFDVAEKQDELNMKDSNDNYRVSSTNSWPPPPPTNDHKMVRQLDDVTKDSEEKATQIFDKLEIINNFFVDAEGICHKLNQSIKDNVDTFTKLSNKFPNVETFSKMLEKNQNILADFEQMVSDLQLGQDEIMMTMDMMQYQDIHRQKIERVINVMRALSKYMNSLFEGKIEDEKRVGSAVYIDGDTDTEEVVSNKDIEALIESLGKK